MSQSEARGRFVWYELMTPDPEAAQSFYRRVVGWGTQDWPGAMAYTMWTAGETPIGGVMKLPEEAAAQGAPPHWLAYVGTEDVDAAAARALELGGRVLVAPQDVPGAGRFAILADPQGAVFAIYASAQTSPEEAPGPGRFSWHELMTTDYQAALSFYGDLFGWQKTEAMDMGEMGIYQMYGRPGAAGSLGGMMNILPDRPLPPHWLLYAMVGDLDTAVETVRALGGQVVHGPVEVPGGDRIAVCTDPQGAAFALHARGVVN